MKRPSTEYLAIHCSATADEDIGRFEIDRWHRQRGWLGIGYHYVIRRNGHLEIGRAEDAVGAHVQGYNEKSIGICMVGGVDANDRNKARNNFTEAQWTTLTGLLRRLHLTYPKAVIQGHRDFPNVQKACPSFDVRTWLKKVRFYESLPGVSAQPDGVSRPEGSDPQAARPVSDGSRSDDQAGGQQPPVPPLAG